MVRSSADAATRTALFGAPADLDCRALEFRDRSDHRSHLDGTPSARQTREGYGERGGTDCDRDFSDCVGSGALAKIRLMQC